MSGGHTPGPWEACAPGDYGDFDGNSQVVLGDDMRIAVVHWSSGSMRDENEANARLIAAAPRVVEAAQPIVAEIAHYADSAGEDDDEAVPIRLGDIRRLRAAIAKATATPADPARSVVGRG